MDIEKTISTPVSETEKSGRLASILADMLRSALAWEKEHGSPQDSVLETTVHAKLPGIVGGEEKHDHDE